MRTHRGLPVEVAGVALDGEGLNQLLMTAFLPDVPIEDAATGRVFTPGDDMTAALAGQLGLDPGSLTDAQRSDIQAFIAWAGEA